MTDEKAREDFMNDVYNTLDFLPTNNEANRIIDSFDRVTSGLEQQEKTGWVPISERLPESEGYGHNFLCCLENGIIRILGYSNILTTRCPKGFYYEKENGTTWRQDINPVIAWMPLPEPYKAESEDKE